jgi:hypothetical protein
MASCGYPIDPDKWTPDFGIHGDHGAIAYDAQAFSAALTARYLTQDEADDAALQRCGAGCVIVLRFEGAGQCGAIAGGSNRIAGVGSGMPQADAESAALEQCSSQGGVECAVRLVGCND